MPYPKIIITVKYKYGKNKKEPPPIITTTYQAIQVLRQIMDIHTILWREELLMLCLNSADKLLGWYRVSIGGTNSSICDKRIITTVAVGCTAAKVILAHNHPAGTLIPSRADLHTTEDIKQALCILDIQLKDHIIITDTEYFSFSDECLL